MSQTTLQDSHARTEEQMPGRRRGRALIVVVLIIALGASALLRDVARTQRIVATTGNSPMNAGGATLSSMNSFTLALLLGGLRGPLVMMLWTSSETQKQDKNLEDFDTKVELIRLLQPEFDSVLLFQIWNKAYNISVQMSSLHNKYVTILDAIEYGNNALRARPDNINVTSAVADVYFNKLGNSAEKQYYRAQVRKETLPHRTKSRADDKTDPGWRRTQMDALVDEKGNILPQYLRPTRQRPENHPAGQAFNDGSELQYMKDLEPYTYGVSPFAIGYNYFMQAQTLQRVSHAKHAQTSEMVVDSRPAIALKFWAEEEQEIGRRNELHAFNIPAPANAGTERITLEAPAAGVKLDQKPTNPAKVTEAIYNYERAAELTRKAVAEYGGHLKLHPQSLDMYRSHVDGLTAVEHFSLADAAYLRAMQSQNVERQKWKEVARREYEETILRYIRITLKYYTDEAMIAKALPFMTRDRIDTLTLEQLLPAMQRIGQLIAQSGMDSHAEDRAEYGQYIQRCQQRLMNLEG